MKNFIPSFVIMLLLLSSATIQKRADFSGKLVLKIAGETFTYDAMTRSGSRLSFQDKGIAVYIVNPDGEGTIAQITLLSTEIYNSPSHTYELGNEEQPKTMLDIYNKDPNKNKDILSFKFRRIDKMGTEEYIKLKKGSVKLNYDDKAGNITLNFDGEDKNGTSLSGSLELRDAYLMDRRD